MFDWSPHSLHTAPNNIKKALTVQGLGYSVSVMLLSALNLFNILQSYYDTFQRLEHTGKFPSKLSGFGSFSSGKEKYKIQTHLLVKLYKIQLFFPAGKIKKFVEN